jgi:hypothetical protein
MAVSRDGIDGGNEMPACVDEGKKPQKFVKTVYLFYSFYFKIPLFRL